MASGDSLDRGALRGVEAATGWPLDPPFPASTLDEVAEACARAEGAFDTYRALGDAPRAAFLEAIGEEIMALGDALIDRAALETGLAHTRLAGERIRTVGQLNLFAGVVRDGRWRDVRIDPAQPDRVPLPRPDLRMRKVPLGPVAVFGASNFPLAFSTAGGDTASALAAGCPVVVKGHPAHPGADALVADAIRAAVRRCGMPDGVFGHVRGHGNELGAALVADPRIAAVGFTGSRAGGLALLRIAQQREAPIPVYAEMSSINPVVLMPAALRSRGAALGRAFVQSLTLGSGQFCTNPGLVLAIEGPGLADFLDAAARALGQHEPQPMLTSAILGAYARGAGALSAHPAVTPMASGLPGDGITTETARLFATDARSFLRDRALGQEVFGAAALVVRCSDLQELKRVLTALEGQLTATLQTDPEDYGMAAELVPILERRAGRVLVNGWPTGVEVAQAMVHGGPYPATSDARVTSVGALAIERFLRPVCYQDFPGAMLPSELRDDAAGPKLVDGVPG